MTDAGGRTCRRCGYVTASGVAAVCRRCGLPYGAVPATAGGDAPSECPVCYARPDRSGLYAAPGGGRTTYERHAYDHELRPVGDDDWLETLRDGDDIVIERWRAPFDLTRRYLVTGQWEGGAERTYAHNAVVLAMVGAAREARVATLESPGAASEGAAGGVRPTSGLGLLRRRRRPAAGESRGAAGPVAESDATVEARRAVEALRERYLAGSRR